MIRMRPFFTVGLLCALLLGGWLWWVKPKKVDMASYAPANSLLYLEANRPLDVIEALSGTDAWKIIDTVTGHRDVPRQSPWIQGLIGWTGIGPIQSVILARVQVAIVVTDFGTTEEGDTLRIRPEGAAIIETHTSESRIRSTVEQALKRLAEITYGKPTFRKSTIDGIELIQWTAPEGGRQIVATIVGGLVIVGNTERVVRNCLAVALHHQSALKEDPELDRMRLELGGEQSLTFGYVPSASSPRLLSTGVPLIMGQAPIDSALQRLIAASAPKVLGSLGWSSRPFKTGMEDRYQISLQPAIVAHLKPDFIARASNASLSEVLPNGVQSVTYYRFENPAGALQNLKTAVSSQIDALSAVVFASLLKSALLPYGIDEPEKFLEAVNTHLLTMRIDQTSERSMLIAGVRDQPALRQLINKGLLKHARSARTGNIDIFEDSEAETAVAFMGDFVVMGSPEDVRRYTEPPKTTVALNDAEWRRITFFAPISSSANVLTYTNDGDRVRSFVSSLLASQNTQPTASAVLEQMVAGLPYSATETTLGERGLERTTRSPLGLFSTLLPLLDPQHNSPPSSAPTK